MKRKFKEGDHVYLKSKKDLAKILPREITEVYPDGEEFFIGYTNHTDVNGDNVVSVQDLMEMRDQEYIVELNIPKDKRDMGMLYVGLRKVGSEPGDFSEKAYDDSLSAREDILCRPKEYKEYKSKRTLSTKFNLLHKLHGEKDE